MSTDAGASTFPLEIAGDTTDMDHEEFHDIDVDNDKPSCKNHNSETSLTDRLICKVRTAK